LSVRSRVAAPAMMPPGPGTSLAVADPAAMRQAAADVSQMDMSHPFAPGEPVGPYDGYDRYPRQFDFTTGFNIATRPRSHERVSFETLRGLIDAYDVASICIWHTIDTLRGLKWKLIAADGYNGDVTDAIRLGTQVMRRPDRKHNFRTWFGKWFYDVLAYDAAPLYRLRNRAGKVTGLLPFDGTTLAPLLDYWGNSPEDGAEAYVQYVNGLPWNWLTRADVIYEPFRAVNSSPYGKAPIESIILNANTDIRFQLHFLMRFTEGNIPEAFASSPESWSPDQIEQFQGYWDSFMYGDQSRKHQIKWMPGGSTISWTNERDFSDQFSLFMMRKTCSAFHKVPTDLGFTDNANYATGESQADVAHKVGELPPMEYTEEIISRFLYDDLGLPVKFEWDRGEDQDDRLNQAQADEIYINSAVVGASEIREMRFGLPEPEGQTVPRIFMTQRGGPVPLNSLMGVAGKIDPETGAPDPRQPLPHEAFTEIAGVIPNPPLVAEPLAEQEFGPSAMPPAPAPQPQGVAAATAPVSTVAKEDGGAAGITSETGIYGYDLTGGEDEDPGEREQLARSELAAFRRFAKSRQRAGTWRDFRFEATDAGTARRLNEEGREAVAKAGGAAPKAPSGPAQQPAQQQPPPQQPPPQQPPPATPPPVSAAWPGWALDLSAIAFWLPAIASAQATAVLAVKIAEAWIALHLTSPASRKPDRVAELAARAEKWLRGQGAAASLEDALAGPLEGVLTDGYAIGAASAQAAVQAGPHLGSVAADMGGWEPGATSVARELAGSLGGTDQLADLLRDASVTIKSIAVNRLGDLARALAEGAEAGDSADVMAQAISGLLSDPSRAQMIVATELARAANSAAMWQYRFHGVEQVRLVTCEDARVCALCDATEAAGALPLADAPLVPLHPLCRCSLIPAGGAA
jgi:portal protein